MSVGLTAGRVASITGGTLRGEGTTIVDGFADHHANVRPGLAFVAVRTGHAYVADALAAGASMALVERDDALPGGAAGVVVASVQDALADLATHHRARLDVRVVAVTGSTGKTVTKDLVAAAAGARFRVHATAGNYNTEIGLPMTVLACPGDAEVLVAELGARHPGEIGELARIVSPDVGIVTGIGVAHVGEFGSREAIARTKGELLQALAPDGLGIVPSTDDYLSLLSSMSAARLVTVGPAGAVRAEAVELGPDGCATATVVLEGSVRIRLRVPVPGRPLVRNAAMALVAARALGVDVRVASEAIARAPVSKWRMHVSGVGSRTLVNDAYNANPTSMHAALRTVSEMAGQRPCWALLAHMAELGDIGPDVHTRAGRLAAALGFDRVVAIGPEAAGMAEGAGAAGVRAATADEALEIARNAPAGAVVLVKGSRAAGLERLAALLEQTWDESHGTEVA